MKVNRILFLLLALFCFSWLQAGVVTEEQALQKAEQFLKGKKIKSHAATRSEKKSGADFGNAFYVFNVENNGGFVIISGDDRTPEILGYAESGSFVQDNLPPAMKALLNYYGYQIKQIQSGQKRATTRGISHENVKDLLKTMWDQTDPYNMSAPMGYSSNDDTPVRCVTGCVATAMAQVLYYQQVVDFTQAEIPGYELQWESPSGNKSETLSDIPKETPLDWGNMLYSYDKKAQATDIEKEAVANLMLYCGMAVNMQYGPDGSSASLSSIPSAFKNYFGYSRGTKYIQRNWYTDDEWDNLIYNEISSGRPVIYGGQTENNEGHAFIVHGYKDGLYAINWGWGGFQDNYFLLDNLTPDRQGTGGGTVGQGFNLQQDAVINLQKKDESFSETVRFTTEYMRLGEQKVFTADNGTFEFSFEVKFTSRLANAYDISYNFAFYKDDVFMCNLSSDDNPPTFASFSSSHYFPSTGSMSFKFGNLPDGVYKIVPISRQYGSDTWLENEGSDKYYLSAVVNGDQLTLYVGEPSNEDPDIVFTEKTKEGVDVTFKVLDTEAKTVQVGEGTAGSQAVDRNTTGTVTIPAKVNDYTVVALGKYAFANCSDVAKVVLPEGITAIAANAFENATNMKTMMLPASIQTIGSEAFMGCSLLKQIINMNPNPINLSPVEARGMSRSGTRSTAASQFDGISSDCILYVPAASKSLYENDPQWSGSFKDIVGVAGMGDANHDAHINQKDAVDVIDYLLTNNPDKILFGVSDMNGDDAITVTDLVKIIDASQGHAGSRRQK